MLVAKYGAGKAARLRCRRVRAQIWHMMPPVALRTLALIALSWAAPAPEQAAPIVREPLQPKP